MSAVGHDQARGHIERGGLAGTVGAQQTYDLTLLHVEAHVVHHGTLAIPLDESFRAQDQPFFLLYGHTVRLLIRHFVHTCMFNLSAKLRIFSEK